MRRRSQRKRRPQRFQRKPGSFDRFTSAQINSEGEKLLQQEPLPLKMKHHWIEREEKQSQPGSSDRILQRRLMRIEQQRHAALALEYQRLLQEGVKKGILLPD